MFIETKLYPDVDRILKIAGGYQKKGQCEIREFKPMDLYSHWDGGSKYFYTMINLETMQQCAIPENGAIGQLKTLSIEKLPMNFAIVQTVVFCGKPMFPRIYLNPDNITKLIAPQSLPELTKEEIDFLCSYRSLKSSYRPRNDALKNSLIEKGYLDKRGAVTVAGKNIKR